MSRLVKKPIKLPEGVSLAQEGDILVVKGPKGERRMKLPSGLRVEEEKGTVRIKFETAKKNDRAILGTCWSLVRNAIKGVHEGFLKVLEIEGVGYKAVMEEKNLVLHIGYTIPIRFTPPAGVTVEVDKNTIKVSGIDKELVGQVAANIRSLKKPEPYKGKGIRYLGEVIRRKVGKKAVATTT